MLYGLQYTRSEMHREGSPLNPVIGSTGHSTDNGNALHTGTETAPSLGGDEMDTENNDINSHDWMWRSNCLHPYSDPQGRSQVNHHQGNQEIIGTTNNGYLPSSHYHHHHHHHHHLSHPPANAASGGLYLHDHYHHNTNNHPHHHHHDIQQQQQQHQQQQQQHQTHCNNGHQKYTLPGSKPDERSPHHPALSLSVGYNAAAVAAAAAIAAAAAAAAAATNSGNATAVTLAKPKRRRIPTMAQRRAANIRERRRMFNLNEAFDTLRKRVPTFAYEKRLSRIETLRLAITYISFMTDVVGGKEPANIKLHGTKTFTWDALHSLSPELSFHGKSPSSS